MNKLIATANRLAARIEAATDGWASGLIARFAFAAVLLVYFWNSALTKLGDGPFGIFSFSDSAYLQILPQVMERYGYDASAIPTFPYGLVVAAGTWAEFILPLLIVLGLFTRLAALGMIGFVLVQSMVDVTAHNVGGDTLGALFDRHSDALIWDQRTLWVALLLILVVKGGGALSMDGLLFRRGDTRP